MAQQQMAPAKAHQFKNFENFAQVREQLEAPMLLFRDDFQGDRKTVERIYRSRQSGAADVQSRRVNPIRGKFEDKLRNVVS